MAGNPKVLLVGCGKMGGAMLRGWLARGMDAADAVVVEPFEDGARAIERDLGVKTVSGAGAVPGDFSPDIVVFAVKPQGMDDIVPDYKGVAGAGAAILSIAAGRTVGYFESHLGTDAAIVRTMPNTPAAVGRGITAAYANAHVSDAQRAACQNLLEAVGEAVWVDDEGLMDAVTAVSGSGPAYVFYMIECMARAGVQLGLPENIADRLARATVTGSGELARLSDEPADVLRTNVTSPGGTTAAALEVLMADADGLAQLMLRALDAAARRSRELAG